VVFLQESENTEDRPFLLSEATPTSRVSGTYVSFIPKSGAVQLTRTDILVGIGELDEEVPAEYRTCALLHVTSIEPVDLAAPAEQPTGNPS
jgi:hypothetical protein